MDSTDFQFVPAGWRRARHRRRIGLIAACNPANGTVQLFLRRGTLETSISEFQLGNNASEMADGVLRSHRTLPTVLRVPAEFILERPVVLPLAAEAELAQVLRYELDRLTPFTVNQVFWDYAVQHRDRKTDKLHVMLVLAQRATLLPFTDALSTLGLIPTSLEAQVEGAARRSIALAHPDPQRERRRRLRFAIATASYSFLLAVTVGLPFLQQSQASARLDAWIVAMKPRVEAAEALRRQFSSTAASADAIASTKARLGDSLQVVAILTELLPDDTHLTGLVLHQRHVTIEGQSAEAARLIDFLSAHPLIRNAAFAAPVTRSENGNDLFSIRAEVAP